MKAFRIFACLLILLLLFGFTGCQPEGIRAVPVSSSAPTYMCEDGVFEVFKLNTASSGFIAANYFPRANGAVGDGKTDDSAAVQAAIDKAYENGGGTVYLDRGAYFFGQTVTVKKNVTLVGDYYSPTSKKSGDMTVVIASDALTSNGNVFSVEDGGTLSSITVCFGAQKLSSPVAGDYAVTVNCENTAAVENITLVNAYNGISAAGGGTLWIKNIYISALGNAITADSCHTVYADNINISPLYWSSSDLPYIEDVSYDMLAEYVSGVGSAFTLTADSAIINSIKITDMLHGVVLNCKNGSEIFFSSLKTTDTSSPVSINSAVCDGVFFTNCIFSTNKIDSAYSVYVAAEVTAPIIFRGCIFSGYATVNVNGTTGGVTVATDCEFTNKKGINLSIEDSILTCVDCSFIFPESIAKLSDNAVGIFCNNSYLPSYTIDGGQTFTAGAVGLYNSETLDSDSYNATAGLIVTNSEKIFRASDYGLSFSATDNSAALQSAIDDAAKDGGVVFVDSGIYSIEATVTVKSGVLLLGAGNTDNGTVFKLRTSPESFHPRIRLESESGLCGMVFRESANISELSETAESYAVLAENASSVFIGSVLFDGVGCGICLSATENAVIRDISGSTIKNGIYLNSCDCVEISRVRFSENVGQAVYQHENLNSVYILESVDIKLFFISINNAAQAITVSRNTEAVVTENKDIIINALTATDVVTGIRIIKSGVISVVGTVIEAETADITSGAENAGEYYVSGSVLRGGGVGCGGGKAAFFSCVFKTNTENAFRAYGGKTDIIGCCLANPASATVYITDGNIDFVANAVINENMHYDGIASSYLTVTDIGKGALGDYYNLKMTDYSDEFN